MKRAELVFVPTAVVGHLVSTIEFSKRLLDQTYQFSITILVMKSPFGVTVDQSNSNKSLSAAYHSNIKIIHLPSVDPPTEFECPEQLLTYYIDNHENHVKDTLLNQVLPNTSQIAGVIVDMLCTAMINVANELNVPSFAFFTASAAFLCFLLYLSKRYDQVGKVFDESDPDSIVPSYINPVSTSVLPRFSSNNGGYRSLANHAKRFKETKGIIILVELESHAVHSLCNATANDSQPLVYTVGSLIDLRGKSQVHSNFTKADKIMKWLYEQPPKSVVFLCFGSFGNVCI